jgi:hypothetical protein
LLSEYQKEKTNDEAVAGKKGNVLLAIPATLIFGLAFWLYIIPIAPALNIVNKKIKRVEFKDSVLMGAVVVFTLLYWIVVFSIVTAFSNALFGLAAILFLMLIASLAGPSYDIMRSVRNANVSKNNQSLKDKREKISSLSSSVFDLVKTHKAHHPIG